MTNTKQRDHVNLGPLFDYTSPRQCLEFPFLPTLPKKQTPCDYCGKPVEVTKFQNGEHVFCHNRDWCKNKFFRKQEGAKLVEAARLAREHPEQLKPIEPRTQSQKEICHFFDEGWKWKAIAAKLQVSSAYVRKVLIKFGRFKPDAKFNGIAKKGTGPHSRINQAPALPLKVRQAKGRNHAAAILRLMRKGIKAATAAKKLGCCVPNNILEKSHAYHRLQERIRCAPGTWARLDMSGRVTTKYDDETQFQSAIEKMLCEWNVPFKREQWLTMSNASYDFLIAGKVLCECKVDMRTKTAATCIGQCTRYRNEWRGPVMLLLPSDTCMAPEDGRILRGLCDIVREHELKDYLKQILGSVQHLQESGYRADPFP